MEKRQWILQWKPPRLSGSCTSLSVILGVPSLRNLLFRFKLQLRVYVCRLRAQNLEGFGRRISLALENFAGLVGKAGDLEPEGLETVVLIAPFSS